MRRILLDSVPSTNDYAMDLIRRERPPEHTLVQALEQTAGRGQAGTVWRSERGRNLTVSVILYPVFLEARRQFLLSQAVALAVADAVTALVPGAATSIKWPNDVLCRRRKVAGILVETRLAGARIETAVVGVGLNVNQTTFPPELANAGSLALTAGQPLDLEAALTTLQERLADRYEELRSHPGGIEPAYRSRLHGLGERRVFRTPTDRIEGVIAGVDEAGRLLVIEDGGTTRAWGTKEIALVDEG